MLQLKYFKTLTNKRHVLHKTKTTFLTTKIINIFKQIFKYRSTGLFKPPQGSNMVVKHSFVPLNKRKGFKKKEGGGPSVIVSGKIKIKIKS